MFSIAVGGALWAIGQNLMSLGQTKGSVEKIDRIEAKQIQQQDDITSIRYEAKGANAAAQRVESKLDDGLKDINQQLRQLNIAGHRRQ